MCMGCHPHQPYLTHKEIITVVPPVYEKVDEDCDSEEHMRDVAADCDRTRVYKKDADGNEMKGTYRVEEREEYFVYVDE